MEIKHVDVAVIGAGISGLTAAYEIHKKDHSLSVIVLEAKDRVGGRTQTVLLKTSKNENDYWDVGGQWVGKCQPHITNLLLELGLETHPQYSKGRKFLQVGGHAISSYESSIPSLSGLALIDLQRIINKCEALRKEVDVKNPYVGEKARALDNMSLDTFLRATAWTKAARECVEVANRTMLGLESSQVSALFYILYVAAAGGIKPLVECEEGSGQESTIKGGAQQVSQKLREAINDDSVLVQHPVQSIQQNDREATITCKNGTKFVAKRVVMAIPPHAYNKIDFTPRLPADKQEIIKRMPVGNIVKVIITYDECFWRKEGFSGEIVTNGGPSTACESGPLCIIYDCTTSRGSPALVAFVGGDQAVQWRLQKAEDLKLAVLRSLSSFFGQQVWNFIEYYAQDWGQEPYIDGGPVSSVGPGGMKHFSKALREPFHMIHMAGTESATVWCGFMNGAVQSGLRAAHEVLYNLRPQTLTPADLKDTIYGHPESKYVYVSKSSFFSGVVLKCALALGVVALSALAWKRGMNFRKL